MLEQTERYSYQKLKATRIFYVQEKSIFNKGKIETDDREAAMERKAPL